MIERLSPHPLSTCAALLWLGCSGASPEAADSVRPGSDPLAQVAWLEGRWEGGPADAAAAEHWVRLDDRLYGVGFTARGTRTSFFEVLSIARVGDTLTYTAMPEGRRSVDFPLTVTGEQSAVFANAANDFPQAMRYQRRDNQLSARLSGMGAPVTLGWKLWPKAHALELEAADRAFAADVAARGLDAWVEWFDADGALWRDVSVTGRDAIRAAMTPTFARPGFRLEWAPVASGMAPSGDLGYTIGRSRATWTGATGSPCSVYVTVWRRQTDRATWRALFDAGWDAPCAPAAR